MNFYLNTFMGHHDPHALSMMLADQIRQQTAAEGPSPIPGFTIEPFLNERIDNQEMRRMASNPLTVAQLKYWMGSGLLVLKNECRKRSCPVGGKKAELCIRLARKGYPSADELRVAEVVAASGGAGAKDKKKTGSGSKGKETVAGPDMSGARGIKILDEKQLKRVKVELHKKELNSIVRSLVRLTNSDWHDGYMEQHEKIQEYVTRAVVAMKAVVEVCMQAGASFDMGHEILKIVADTWANLSSIPFRSGLPETDSLHYCGEEIVLLEASESFCWAGLNDSLLQVWPLLLACAANDSAVTEEALLQMIKDAKDHVKSMDFDISKLIENELLLEKLRDGGDKVVQLEKEKGADMKRLPSTVQVYKMRPIMDRRFEGSRNKRTRDYDSDGY